MTMEKSGKKTDDRRIKYLDQLRADFNKFRFLVQSVYDTLSNPVNLYTSGKTWVAKCPRCKKKWWLQYALSRCHKALADERYLWRKGQLLKGIDDKTTTDIFES